MDDYTDFPNDDQRDDDAPGRFTHERADDLVTAMAGPPEADPEPDPDDWKNPRIVRRRDALEARSRERQGYLMQLPYTGGYARVRILSANDKSSLTWIPRNLRAKLARVISELEGTSRRQKVDDEKLFTMAIQGITDANELADAFCIRGFLDPQLVATEDELDPSRDDQMVVTDLHIDERMGYFSKCMMTGEDVRLIDPFRGRPLSDVPGQSRNKATAASQ